MFTKQLIPIAMALLLASTAAYAACREDPREIELRTSDGTKTENVGLRLKRYACDLNRSNKPGRVQVEYNEYANSLASSIISGNLTHSIPKIMGRFQIARNDVFERFKFIVDHYAEKSRLNSENSPGLVEQISVNAADNSGIANVVKEVSTMRVVDKAPDYPAFSEVSALSKSKIPSDISVYYNVVNPSVKPPVLQAVFWRYGKIEDIDNYKRNIREFNNASYPSKIVQNYFKSEFKSPTVGDFNDKYLGLMKYLGAKGLPTEFFGIFGSYDTGACASDGSNSWFFRTASPSISLRSVVLTNKSNHPILIDSLFGKSDSSDALRERKPINGPDVTVNLNITIPANESLIIPTGIMFKSHYDGTTRSSLRGREVYERLLSRHIACRPDVYAEPTSKEYIFGPILDVKGISSEGMKIVFTSTGENLVDVSYDSQAGSCPYLLGWDTARGEWLSYGKILHQARSEADETSQRIVMAGYVPRIRVEEREPEAATLKMISVSLRLADGRSVIAPKENFKTASLSWGDHVDFPVSLPSGIAVGQVVKTEIIVTGYYRRYSSIGNVLWKSGFDETATRPAICLAPAARLRADDASMSGR